MRPTPTGYGGGVITALRTLARDVVRSSRGHDLPLAGQLAGATSVRELGTSLASVVPDQAGARQATRFLANAGTAAGALSQHLELLLVDARRERDLLDGGSVRRRDCDVSIAKVLVGQPPG